MSREKMMQQDETETTVFDIQFALQCAPLFLGLRSSLFLTVTKRQVARIENILRDKRITLYKISENHGKMAVLLFDEKKMKEYIAGEAVQKILGNLGYTGDDLYDFMEIFAQRYTEFVRNESAFPHEMGIFLGYPPEDVRGYLENGGKNYLCAGFWKVYENVQEKIKLFSQFERAQDSLVSLILQGNSLGEAVKILT